MFHTSRSKRSDSSTAITGGLPTFAPQNLARALVREQTPEQTKSAPAREHSPAKAVTTINIDLGSAVRGALAVAEYFGRRQAKKRAEEKELEKKALELAAEYQGLVGVPDLLMRSDCNRQQAEQCLALLEKASLCRYLCQYQEEALYVFPGYLPRVWECDYCASQRPVPSGTPASTLCQCGSCGAAMSQKILA